MPATSKRLEFLRKHTASGAADAFAFYGLAMELRSLELHDESLAAFGELRARWPDYVPAYLMCGQMLEKTGKLDLAKEWLKAGIDAARTKGDAHALGELEAALAALG
ncbi:MAG TPA: tetratricopeptide repeat protein [Polyangiaceae bacterium]